MTEFLLVAENVTETEDADFVLYFGENLSFIPNYADWTWSDTLRSPFTRTKASCWESQVIAIHQQLRKKMKERQCEEDNYTRKYFVGMPRI